MFQLMQPEKEMVGKRIRIVKEELKVSFTQLGNRLGLIKSAINSYAQGYTLAPPEVIRQLVKITGKGMGWFYFGEMEEYIRDYVVKKRYDLFFEKYPEIPMRIKECLINNEYSGGDWKNEFGYPREEILDDIFAEIYHEIIHGRI